MYRLQPIQEAMLTRLGFRQTTNPNLPQLLPALTESESGIYVQDRHPLLNTNNLYMASENFDQWPYEAWVLPVLPDPGYEEGSYVAHINKIWISDIDDNFSEPGTADWTEVNNFSQYLLRMLMNSSQRTVEKIFQYKKLERNTKTLFENIHLFDGTAGRNNLVIKQGRFVGFRVRLLKHKHLTLLLRKLGTQFNAAVDFNIYVYHESVEAPLITVPISHTMPNSFQWHNIDDIVLPYVSDEQDAGGLFFIGYYEDDIPMGVQAITRNDYKWDVGPGCSTCGSGANDRIYFQKWSAFTQWMPVMIGSGMIQPGPGRAKFPNFAAGATYDNNWGLNFHLTLQCDLTEFILENIELLDESYANEVSYQLLNSMAFTMRDNGDAKQIRDKAAFEMTRTDSAGITKLLETSSKALDYEMSGFNTVCLPDSRRGVRTGAMI